MSEAPAPPCRPGCARCARFLTHGVVPYNNWRSFGGQCPSPRGEPVKPDKQKILNTISDLASNFLYYDRKEDEELPRGALEQAVSDGIITVDEMIEEFREELEDYFEGARVRGKMK